MPEGYYFVCDHEPVNRHIQYLDPTDEYPTVTVSCMCLEYKSVFEVSRWDTDEDVTKRIELAQATIRNHRDATNEMMYGKGEGKPGGLFG